MTECAGYHCPLCSQPHPLLLQDRASGVNSLKNDWKDQIQMNKINRIYTLINEWEQNFPVVMRHMQETRHNPKATTALWLTGWAWSTLRCTAMNMILPCCFWQWSWTWQQMREIQTPAFSACDISGQLTVFTRKHHTPGEEASSPSFTDLDVFRKNDRPIAFTMALLICIKWTFLWRNRISYTQTLA